MNLGLLRKSIENRGGGRGVGRDAQEVEGRNTDLKGRHERREGADSGKSLLAEGEDQPGAFSASLSQQTFTSVFASRVLIGKIQ